MNILKLLILLEKGQKLSTSNISNILGVSLRSAQRYIKTIKTYGIQLKKDPSGRYFLNPTPDEKERIILQTFKLFIKTLGFDDIPLVKNIDEKEYFYSKLNIEKINLQLFKKIEYAINTKNIIKIDYLQDKEIKQKTVKPLKILHFEGYWYLGAINSSESYRTYHINSIKKITQTNKKFKLENDILKNLDYAVNIWFNPLKKPFLVELCVDNKIIKYFQRLPLCSKQNIIKHENYSILQLHITHKNEIIRQILSWTPYIAVIKPKWLKQEIDTLIQTYISKYVRHS